MRCDCCGRKKWPFESFASVKYKQIQMNFCIDCNDLAYKIRDDANEHNIDNYDKHLNEWKIRAKRPSKTFQLWQLEFLAPLEKIKKE